LVDFKNKRAGALQVLHHAHADCQHLILQVAKEALAAGHVSSNPPVPATAAAAVESHDTSTHHSTSQHMTTHLQGSQRLSSWPCALSPSMPAATAVLYRKHTTHNSSPKRCMRAGVHAGVGCLCWVSFISKHLMRLCNPPAGQPAPQQPAMCPPILQRQLQQQ
jgi:hypothetical protein